MALKVLLVAFISFGVVAAALAVLLGDTRAESDPTSGGGAERSAVLTATDDEDRPGVGVLRPLAAGPGCSYFGGFYALRQSNTNAATVRNRNDNSQSQTSESRSTNRSTSRVVINGVVVHDETVESNSSGGSQSNSTSTSVSVSSAGSSSQTKVTVNGTVVVDRTTGVAAPGNSFLDLLVSVIAKRLQLETMFLLNWNFAAVAGPGCAAGTP